jgi:hypothetical protein
VDIPAGGARTVALSGSLADLSLTVLPDDLSAPGPGSARVRVLAAAAGAPTVDAVRTEGPALARNLAFGSAGAPTTVPAGASTVRVDAGTGEPIELPLVLPAGSVTSLLVLDRPDGGLTLRPVVDAAGPAAVPIGPVPAGAGGTAGRGSALPALALAGGSSIVALACMRGRRRAALSVGAALSLVATASPVAAVPLVAAPIAVTVPAGASTSPAVSTPPPAVAVARSEAGPGVAVPTRLQVPSAGIDAPLTGIGLDGDGLLTPPGDLATAGWFRQGPVPGRRGPAVIAGHVDGEHRPAVFFHLRDVVVGDTVLVTRADRSTVRFTVSRVARYAKAAFPTAEVYGPTPGAELRLITCGGEFDRSTGSYRDNLVVFARGPAPGRP